MTVPPTEVTPELVAAITGVTVSAELIAQATAIIELAMGIDLSNLANLRAINRRWAVYGICYQAAWMPGQPDLMSRIDVTTISQDGLALTPRDRNSLIIAPLASKALRRVTWKRSRTILVHQGRAARLSRLINGYDAAELSGSDALGTDVPYLAAGGVFDDEYTDDDGSPGRWDRL